MTWKTYLFQTSCWNLIFLCFFFSTCRFWAPRRTSKIYEILSKSYAFWLEAPCASREVPGRSQEPPAASRRAPGTPPRTDPRASQEIPRGPKRLPGRWASIHWMVTERAHNAYRSGTSFSSVLGAQAWRFMFAFSRLRPKTNDLLALEASFFWGCGVRVGKLWRPASDTCFQDFARSPDPKMALL